MFSIIANTTPFYKSVLNKSPQVLLHINRLSNIWQLWCT